MKSIKTYNVILRLVRRTQRDDKPSGLSRIRWNRAHRGRGKTEYTCPCEDRDQVMTKQERKLLKTKFYLSR